MASIVRQVAGQAHGDTAVVQVPKCSSSCSSSCSCSSRVLFCHDLPPDPGVPVRPPAGGHPGASRHRRCRHRQAHGSRRAPLALHLAPLALHFEPLALHPAPLALHPVPLALHHAPLALHLAPPALHPAPLAVHPAPLALHPAPSGGGLLHGGVPGVRPPQEARRDQGRRRPEGREDPGGLPMSQIFSFTFCFPRLD